MLSKFIAKYDSLLKKFCEDNNAGLCFTLGHVSEEQENSSSYKGKHTWPHCINRVI